MTTEIQDMIQASSEGRIDDARALWASSAGTTPTPEDITQFGQQISQRYGRLQRFSIMSTAKSGSMLKAQLDVSGVFVFDHGELLGSATYELQPVMGQAMPQLRLRSLLIEDKDHGDLRLPQTQGGKPNN